MRFAFAVSLSLGASALTRSNAADLVSGFDDFDAEMIPDTRWAGMANDRSRDKMETM
jgi:hypothetical protein